MITFLESYRAGLFKPKNWLSNIIAGLIVGVVALPLAMAFAIASGVKPEQGLYTSIIAGLCVGIFGGSRIQIAGPTGAFIVILASITAEFGVAGLQIATLLAGIILLVMGLLKLGDVIKFIPTPVIVGFTSGIGVIIFVGEWKDFFGLSVHLPLDASFYQKITLLSQALPHLNLITTLLAILSLILVLITPKFFKRLPGPLVAMVVVTALQTVFHFKNVATLGSTFGGIPNHLPYFQLPIVSFDKILNLFAPAFTIALLGAIESLLSATAADRMADTRHHSNQELIGQGIANILCPLFGGFAATGAIARTATNVRNGGNSPISAIVHSITLILVIVLLAPLAANVPLCVLAAILFIVSYNMSDIPRFIEITKRAPYYDVFVLLITFVLTIFINLVVAVSVGTIMAMLFFVRRMSESVKVIPNTKQSLKNEFNIDFDLPENILIYSIQGPLFFGIAEKLESLLMATHIQPNTIIYRLKDVPFMDATGLEALNDLIKYYYDSNVEIYLTEANERVARKLNNAGTLQWVVEQRVFDSINEILEKI